MAADNRHSRFVGTAKIVFPLLALALLSTIFLFSRTLDPSQAIPFSDVDVERIAKEQLLAAPRFSGVTTDGTAISVEAKSARPDLTNPKRLTATSVSAEFSTLSGDTYSLRSKTAVFDGTQDTLDLAGDVRIESSGGYTLTTQDLSADLALTGLLAPGQIEGTVPGGTISAGRMELVTHEGAQLLVFKNGVKLVYDPEQF